MEETTDISLAIDLEDLTLLENIFHVEAPIANRGLDRQLMITTPDKHFSLDVQRRKNILRCMVNVQFGLFDRNEKIPAGYPGEGNPLEVVHFGMVCGVVVSSPILDGEAIAPKHLAGNKAPETHRDEKMEHNMRAEAIKAAYGLAISRMAEQSALSPLGAIMMPLIDADEILDDITRSESA